MKNRNNANRKPGGRSKREAPPVVDLLAKPQATVEPTQPAASTPSTDDTTPKQEQQSREDEWLTTDTGVSALRHVQVTEMVYEIIQSGEVFELLAVSDDNIATVIAYADTVDALIEYAKSVMPLGASLNVKESAEFVPTKPATVNEQDAPTAPAETQDAVQRAPLTDDVITRIAAAIQGAIVVYNSNAGLLATSFESLSASERQELIDLIVAFYDAPESTPVTRYEAKRKELVSLGWTFGELHDAVQKTTPYLCGWDHMPAAYKANAEVAQCVLECAFSDLVGPDRAQNARDVLGQIVGNIDDIASVARELENVTREASGDEIILLADLPGIVRAIIELNYAEYSRSPEAKRVLQALPYGAVTMKAQLSKDETYYCSRDRALGDSVMLVQVLKNTTAAEQQTRERSDLQRRLSALHISLASRKAAARRAHNRQNDVRDQAMATKRVISAAQEAIWARERHEHAANISRVEMEIADLNARLAFVAAPPIVVNDYYAYNGDGKTLVRRDVFESALS